MNELCVIVIRELPRTVCKARRVSLTFEDECSKGGKDVIFRILYIGTIRVNYEKLGTRPFRDMKSRLLTFDFVLRHKLFMNLLAWNF